jgi:hypothetical protein
LRDVLAAAEGRPTRAGFRNLPRAHLSARAAAAEGGRALDGQQRALWERRLDQLDKYLLELKEEMK